MAIDVFSAGIPIASLGARARELGEQLDASPLIPREDPSHLDSRHIEKDEALAALRSLDNWSDPADRAILEKFAAILGLSLPPNQEAAPSAVNVDNTELDDSVTLVNAIDVILTSITMTTGVKVLEMTDNHIEITNPITSQVFDIDVLDFQSMKDNRIAFDLDANFFCRPAWNGQPMMSVGQDDDGGRYLHGIPRDGRSALPKSAQLWLCHPASGRTVRIQTDGQGRFAAALPADMRGSTYVVRVDEQGRGVGAQIELP